MAQTKSIPVIQFDFKGNYVNEYESIKVAAIKNSINASAIGKCCNLKRKYAYNYIWLFKNTNPIIEQQLNDVLNKIYYIKQLNLDNTIIKCWKSSEEIERYYKFGQSNIIACLHNKRNLCGGYKWSLKYVDNIKQFI